MSTEYVLKQIEASRQQAEPELESSLSVNDWIDRIRGAAQTAHSAARVGEVHTEFTAWIDLASIAVARAEILTKLLDNPEEGLEARQDS